jgi:hypothetical protein
MQCSICFNKYEATDKFFDSKRLKTATNRKSKYCICISCLNNRNKKTEKFSKKKEPSKQKLNYYHVDASNTESLIMSLKSMSDKEIVNYFKNKLNEKLSEENEEKLCMIFKSDEEISNYLKEYGTILPVNQSIYIIGPKNGPYKVGIAKDAYTRIGNLQIGCWEELIVHHVSNYVGDARLVEDLIHKTLWNKHIRGEWFNHDLETIKCVVDKIALLGSKY